MSLASFGEMFSLQEMIASGKLSSNACDSEVVKFATAPKTPVQFIANSAIYNPKKNA